MKHKFITALSLALTLPLANTAGAKVPAAEAQALQDGRLMPLGGEMQGSADRSIPAWDGGLKHPPAEWKGNGHRLVDPFPEDQPLFTITAENFGQYKDRLTPGQVALFERYPKTYRLPVYPTRRTHINAQHIYAATYQNALSAVLADGSDALHNAASGIPFPIPKTGQELIWNHKLSHNGLSFRRWNAQLAVNPDGQFAVGLLREDVYAPYVAKDMTPAKLARIMPIYFLQVVKKPAREAHKINLIWQPLDARKEPHMVWQYNRGQKRVRRAPGAAYDHPAPGSDGLGVVDQIFLFNGALDRYDWKIVGKKELYIPYNAYRLHSGQVKYQDLARPGHLNPDHTRYELHRVWVLEATLKSGTNHIYARRTLYQDEDSWGIAAVDCYDARGELWRVQEGHPLIFYDQADPHRISAAELIYDLHSHRYLIQALNNEEDEHRNMDFPAEYFTQANLENIQD